MAGKSYLAPLLQDLTPRFWKLLSCVITLAVMAPFLLALMLPPSMQASDKAGKSAALHMKMPRVVMLVFRLVLALGFIITTITSYYSLRSGVLIGLAVLILLMMLISRKLNAHLRHIENTFISNLNERDLRRSGKNNTLVSDLHLAYITVGYGCPFVGDRLKNSDLRRRYGVDVASIQRGPQMITIPSGDTRIFPGDTIGIIGTDDQISHVLPIIEAEPTSDAESSRQPSDIRLTAIELTEKSPLIGQTLASADVRRNYNTHVVAMRRGDTFIDRPATLPLCVGDRLWIVAPDAHTAATLEGAAK